MQKPIQEFAFIDFFETIFLHIGYYADSETRCQVFHVCSKLPDGQYIQNSFLCPNGTIFKQQTFSCEWLVFPSNQ